MDSSQHVRPIIRTQPPSPADTGASAGTGSVPPRSQTVSNDRIGYRRKVGFDSMDEYLTGHPLSTLTLQSTTSDYKRLKNSRIFLVGASTDVNGQRALDFVLMNLLENGDEIVAMRVFDDEQRNQDNAREEAEELLESIRVKNDEFDNRQISIVVEFIAGKITTAIRSLISLHRPDSFVVGSRGKSGTWTQLSSAFASVRSGAGTAGGMGSVSRWSLSNSKVPTIVVRNDAKVKESLAKRANDSKRRSYHSLLQT
ncbi:hypothetical protein E3P92_03941 [Wallemia ichthyophaga]|uniref:UspA domain-containing protein n=2 Tax=Wallemia ichthyophaga TaxID=245174 RepID=A0A4T0KY71_WALIC|nr:Universal stress protein A family protein C25B2.10 [Wallemia ichthyophaga EXF-994]TIA68677.1 hypothetical protein E3P91_03984 [Wallemia ichthyophaga]EOR03751.1 Universal stress protein A family protein C25B2.10 [Wallemia ichthyophaga EXF-994]TIA78236.1 hypothetical protein E3P98_03931 [Wallemia ichthyophaga]TIA89151.1 hypothetical protein E3P97_03166 [Wallemia ichthyophaga]TIA94991.1 hypothetical protein E3P95_03930 [Wallemia ichthyophaga]